MSVTARERPGASRARLMPSEAFTAPRRVV